MSLITCNECGNQVSGTARVCPQCGAKGKALTGPPPKKQASLLSKLVLGFFGVGFAITGFTMIKNPGNGPTVPPSRAETPEINRNTQIVLYAKSLTAAMRDPDSVIFDKVRSNDDGSLVCFNYRAKNGFGGTNRDLAAFTPAGGGQGAAAVRALCRDKGLKDVTYETVPLIKMIK